MTIMVGSIPADRQAQCSGSSGELISISASSMERIPTGMAWALETPKPSPSDTSPRIRPHFLILLKYFYQLVPRYLNG